jgi:hypothetical protein
MPCTAYLLLVELLGYEQLPRKYFIDISFSELSWR